MKIKYKVALLPIIPLIWFGLWGLSAYRQQEGLICSILALATAGLMIVYSSVGFVKALKCREEKQ